MTTQEQDQGMDVAGKSPLPAAGKEDGGPAFAHGNSEQGGDPGMSLRDWFAGQILRPLIWQDSDMRLGFDDAAREAYQFADAMLRERNKPTY